MNREDIIQMAIHAGFITIREAGQKELIHFANLVAAAERDECCKIVYGQCESDNVAQRTVDAIRARGKK